MTSPAPVMCEDTLFFGILGPLLVRRGESPIPLRSPRERAALAMLLIRPGRAVPVDELAEALWPGQPPANPRNAVQTRIRRLRQRLGPTGRLVIRTEQDGYAIDTPAMDLTQFREIVAAAARARRVRDHQREVTLLREALALWRGRPLADISPEVIPADVPPALAEERIAVLHQLFDAELALGRSADVIGQLRAAAAEYPLRERFWAQLMIALDRSGSPGDALVAFETVRAALADELGTDPGPELRYLHARLLAAPGIQPRSAATVGLFGNEQLRAYVQILLGRVLRDTDQYDAAMAAWQDALGVFTRLGDRQAEDVSQLIAELASTVLQNRGPARD